MTELSVNNWRLEEIRTIDRKSRKVLTMYKMLQPEAYIGKKEEETCYVDTLKRQSRDNQYCRIFENKIYRRPVCKYC